MKELKILASSILAGLCIGIGGTVFLSLDSKVLGALFFTAGLFTICTHGLHLFTGKVCYVFERDLDYAAGLPVIWLGNLIGTWCVAQAAHCTRIGSALKERAAALCTVKLNDHLLSVFLLAAFCNILIYIAVEGYGSAFVHSGHDPGQCGGGRFVSSGTCLDHKLTIIFAE